MPNKKKTKLVQIKMNSIFVPSLNNIKVKGSNMELHQIPFNSQIK